MALAMEWVAKITTVGLEMVLPGIAGYYLDARFNTRFWAILGFALGLVIGLWQLIRWARPRTPLKPDN